MRFNEIYDKMEMQTETIVSFILPLRNTITSYWEELNIDFLILNSCYHFSFIKEYKSYKISSVKSLTPNDRWSLSEMSLLVAA